jgi:TolB-like protein/tRNA A-37 threonylcarbamoyl transferase component Bud32/tetratricopeptide (TPR) repeat protein
VSDRQLPLSGGSTLGPYVIIRSIDAGGMGEVYEARDTRLDRRVALKVVRHDLASDAARRQRLEREARAAAGLNHPHIVTLHSLEEHAGVLFLTMELIDGTTLGEAIPRDGILVDQLLHVAIQLTDAIATAHQLGIVHRDLKPANVMLTRTGHVKILDFGLSKRSEQNAEPPTTQSLTGDGALLGTAPYMPPEVIEGREADARSDIFSLGVLLFEMATGQRPFRGETPLATIGSILRDTPPLANTINPAVPLELAELIQRCLEKDPSRRRQSASDLRADLENLATRLRIGKTTPAAQSIPPPAPASISPARPSTRRTAVVVAGTIAGIALLAGGIYRFAEFPAATTAGAMSSLAVLPLEDVRREGQEDYFSDGMTESMITNLARIEGLRVVPRSAVTSYRGTRRIPAVIAKELEVDAILDGSVAKDGGKVRVNLTLIDPRLNRTMWASSYERDLSDILHLHSEIARTVAVELGLELTSQDEARLAIGGRTVNPTAYDLYLRGVMLLERVNARDAEAAAARLEEAVGIDPTFADAFGALASAYVQLYGSYGPKDAERLEPKARDAITRALALDPDSVDALAAHGDLIWDGAHGWRHEEAVQAHRRAIALKPNYVYSQRRLATIYNHIGLAEAALRELGQSEDTPAVLMQKGLALRILGKDDLALSAWRAIPRESLNTNHIGHIAWTLADQGKTSEALEVLRGAHQDTVDVNGVVPAVEALLHAVAGRRQQAQRSLASAIAQAAATRESHHATYVAAAAYARLGNRDEALRWLRFSAADGFPCYPLMARDRNLDALRSYAPFMQFMEESRTRYEGYRARLVGDP